MKSTSPTIRSGWALLAASALVAAAFQLLPGRAVFGQEADKPNAAAEEAVRKAATAFQEAIENGDTEAVAKTWTPDADYVDHQGHAFKIQAALAAAKDLQKDGRIARPPLKLETLGIRFLSPDVAVEDGIVERAMAEGAQPTKGRYCAMWVKRDGNWLLDGVRESVYSPVTSANHFADLDWLVGDWAAEGQGVTAEASFAWGPKKHYLLRQMKLTRKGQEPVSSTQWIGWDPVHERVRSFEFDNEGGFHDGEWVHDGDAWVVSTIGVEGDGHREAVTYILTRVDENTAIWELVDEELDGVPGNDLQLRATRKAAKGR